MKIHPTAAVDSSAVLADDVEIGAFAVVGPEIVIGAGSIIQSHVVLEGVVRIGAANVIGHGTVIGGPPQDLGFNPDTRSSVEIGDANVVREHCTIHRGTAEGTATTLGDSNFLMAGAHVGHNCRIANRVIIANNCLLGGYVRIDDLAFLGGGTMFHQKTHVGRLVITQGSSAFGKDIPPFLVAAERNLAVGVNVLGLRRAGMTGAERDEIKHGFKLLYRSGLNIRQALAKAAETKFGPLGREFFEFVGNVRKRGIVSCRRAPKAQ
ncbi:MAG: acyl-ACP--UDP-N-acetylglucosamine O-acyltransferase [Chthoniobacterales bacterium]|nr:acyl-ACP--UDP-N-acetylglucosamine O-acyltransferase [Chthoniobacterales bacterium]